MAYDLDPTKKDEDDATEAQSRYAGLLATSAPEAGGTVTPSAAPSPQSHPGGFVNADRYMNANKSVVENLRSRVADRGAGLNADVSKARSEMDAAVKASPHAPDAATHPITNNTAAGTQHDSLSNAGGTNRNDAIGYANAAYKGPTQAAVDSKYAPLLARQAQLTAEANAARMGDYSSIVPGATALDNRLIGADVGRSLYDRTKRDASTFKDAFTESSTAATGAQSAHEAEKSKWSKLLGDYDRGEADRVAAETAAKQAAVPVQRIEQSWQSQGIPWIVKNMGGIEGYQNIMDDLNRFSPQERQTLMESMNDPLRFSVAFEQMRRKSGVTGQGY